MSLKRKNCMRSADSLSLHPERGAMRGICNCKIKTIFRILQIMAKKNHKHFFQITHIYTGFKFSFAKHFDFAI